MLNVAQFRALVVRPTLVGLGLHSEAAERLVLGTALTESQLTMLRQIGGGPALGLYQIEPATHDDLWANFLRFRANLAQRTALMAAPGLSREAQLVCNLAYATAICRLLYFRRPERLPEAADGDGLAAYWKAHFNTENGKGAATHFASALRTFEV